MIYNKTMKRLFQLGNIVSLLFALIANFLIGAQIINVRAIKEVSDAYATYLTPAAYAFSIWSVIYALLIVFAVYQARDVIKSRSDNTLPQAIGPLFIIASICNGLWTFVFVQEQIGLSFAILLLLIGSLYTLLWRLNIAREHPPLATLLCVWWPLLLYTGWVTVATVVNAASWLESLGITLSSMVANIVLIILTLVLMVLLVKRNVRELVIASTWGVAAIGAEQIQQSADQSIAVTAFVSAGILLFAVAFHAYRNRQAGPFKGIGTST
jgi:translocator protein